VARASSQVKAEAQCGPTTVAADALYASFGSPVASRVRTAGVVAEVVGVQGKLANVSFDASSLGAAASFHGAARFDVTVGVTRRRFLGGAKISLGGAESSLGNANIPLVTLTSRWVTLTSRWVTLRAR
jgi:hypothetical protein